MPLELVKEDITKLAVDAIVNAATPSLLGRRGVSGAIHRAAGPELLAECLSLGGCPLGSAKITQAYRLPCKHVIHTVAPRWQGGSQGEDGLLASCYRNSLALAFNAGCTTVAFPLLAAGSYGYPKDRALQTALDSIRAFLLEHELTVYLVLYRPEYYQLSPELAQELDRYIADHYEAEAETVTIQSLEEEGIAGQAGEAICFESMAGAAASDTGLISGFLYRKTDLDQVVEQLDESFSAMLLRKIDEKGLSDVQCYKRANISRQLFSKIRNDRPDRPYRPSKVTVLALAVALELSLAETQELLLKAGFALSPSYKLDLIVEYFISKGIYDLDKINQVLFSHDQPLLGNASL